jgi:hypothetical protein
MAYPVISPVTTTEVFSDTNNATSFSINMPASVPSGAKILIWVTYRPINDATSELSSASWVTERYSFAGGLLINAQLLSKDSDGTEGGTSITVSGAVNMADLVAHVYVLSGGTVEIESSSIVNQAASASIATITAPTVTPSWGSADNVYFTLLGSGRGGALTSAKAGYTTTQTKTASAQYDVSALSGHKQSTATSDSAGTYSYGTYNAMAAIAVVARILPATASITLTQTEITPNGTISGSYANWGGTAPALLEAIRAAISLDSNNQITGLVITGDGVSGTYTATMPDLPTVGNEQYIRFSAPAAGIVDPTWRLS